MLRDITKDLHDKAEKTVFAQKLLNNVTKKEYSLYLKNQAYIYNILEFKANEFGILRNLPGLGRASYILEDYFELRINSPTLETAKKYHAYVINIEEKERILAHLYVRHFGDLYGGQIIKKNVPGSGRMYEFEDRKTLINKVREKLDDSMGDEARVCFQYAIDLFEEIEEYGTRV